jgi:hypothetical protein
MKAKLVRESLNEISSEYLDKKLAAAKASGRGITPEYEKVIKQKHQTQTAKKTKEDQENQWRSDTKKMKDAADDIANDAKEITLDMDSLSGKYIMHNVSASTQGFNVVYRSEDPKNTTLIEIYYKIASQTDILKIFLHTEKRDNNKISFAHMPQLIPILVKTFKKHFPESQYTDRKIYSAL